MTAEQLSMQSADENRKPLFVPGIWRSRGTWSPTAWCLGPVVEHRGRVVGPQSLVADDFPRLRTVDSGSRLEPDTRAASGIATTALPHFGVAGS